MNFQEIIFWIALGVLVGALIILVGSKLITNLVAVQVMFNSTGG